jgi:hypothetical protein
MEIKYSITKKDSEEFFNTTKLQPLDGQQRLTTLYLLHWYLIQRVSKSKNEQLEILRGFQYKTRKTTSEFCIFLTCNEELKKTDFNKITELSKFIENNTSFYKYWNNDPSVKGMLVVLQKLHSELNSKTIDELSLMLNALIEERKITFDFLDLENLDQTDELYVKMNARGKQLSDFEHFKAWLQDKNKLHKSIWDKLDTEWLNLFWKNKPDNEFEVDNNIYKFIKSINLFQCIIETKNIDISFVEKLLAKRGENYIPLSQFGDKNFFNTSSLDFVFNSLDSIDNKRRETFDKELENIYCYPFRQKETPKLGTFFIGGYSNFNYWDRVYYYAYILYSNSIKDNEEYDLKELKSWMRICRNIIYNTYIQNPSEFISAVNAIHSFFKLVSTSGFSSFEDGIIEDRYQISFFGTQLKEEKLKLSYFKKGENWKETIIKLENHEYFYGQIQFIFDLNSSTPNDFDNFKEIGDILSTLFTDIEKDNFLFQRALLAIGDYLIDSGDKYSFCKSDTGGLRVRNYNWRIVFNRTDKQIILKSLLERIQKKESLQDICSLNIQENLWRRYIINHPEIIEYCNDRLINFVTLLDIKLLKGANYKGKHTDLFLYIIWLQLKEKGLANVSIEHEDVNNYRTKETYPQIKFYSQVKDKYYFAINYQMYGNGNYGFQFRFEEEIQPPFLELVNGMVENEKGIFDLNFSNEIELSNVLNNIIDKLNLLNENLGEL